ncbi:MAG TPA: hypothetical protein VIX37_01795 [Candidatus Sulfotelmatobacter sp.]
MSSRNRLVLPLILFSLAILAGCGASSFNSATPPPGGSFSNSDLNGTYVFSAVGSNSSGVFFALVGTLVANGSGGITGGTLDLNDPTLGVFPALAISSGSYRVTIDGRGTATLNTSQGSIGLAFVLSSSSHGLVTRFDTSGTGSGTLDLQSTVTQSQIAGSYAFNFTGISGLNSTTGAQPTLATVGAFTLDASGNVTSGVQDFNNNGSSVGLVSLPLTGSVSLATVPGVATLMTSVGTLKFDVYPVDATHLKLIEVDAAPIMVGDAFTQTSSIPTGPTVFTVAGFDTVAGGPFTAAGIIVTDGNGNVTAGSEDINDAFVASTVTNFTGSYPALSGGRSVLTLAGFNNGANGVLCPACQFAAYPSSGGLQLLEIDNAGSTAGVAYPQTPTALPSAQGYGLNLTGVNAGNGTGGFEEDDIAEFTNTSGTFAGLIDINDQGTLSPDQKFGATYTADATINGRGTVASSSFNLVSFSVDSSTTVFVEVDNNQVGLGSFGLQTPTAKSNAAAMHLAALHLRTGARSALRSRQK